MRFIANANSIANVFSQLSPQHADQSAGTIGNGTLYSDTGKCGLWRAEICVLHIWYCDDVKRFFAFVQNDEWKKTAYQAGDAQREFFAFPTSGPIKKILHCVHNGEQRKILNDVK